MIILNKYQKRFFQKVNLFHRIEPWDEYRKVIQTQILFSYLLDNFHEIHKVYDLIHCKQNQKLIRICKMKAKQFLEEISTLTIEDPQNLYSIRSLITQTTRILKEYIHKVDTVEQNIFFLFQKINDNDLVQNIMEYL